jgi:hypothetical protein
LKVTRGLVLGITHLEQYVSFSVISLPRALTR